MWLTALFSTIHEFYCIIQTNFFFTYSIFSILLPKQKLRACLANKISSLNFRHSISITHHSSLITHNSSLITYHSIFHIRLPSSLNFHHSLFFTLFGGPTPVTVQFFFFFFFFNTQNPEPSGKKKKKNPVKTEPSEEEREKKK